MMDEVMEIEKEKRIEGNYKEKGGREIENIRVSMEKGMRVLDDQVGGIGGCKLEKGEKGNVEKVEVVEMMNEMGFEKGIDMERIRQEGLFKKDLSKDKEE